MAPQSSPGLAQPLKIGIVGAGQMAQHHARALAQTGARAQLVAVCDPYARALSQMREIATGATGFSSAAQMLSSAALDVVHVCTPPQTHARLAREAIEAGCHVYVEKPFTESAADAVQVLELAERHRRKVCAGHQLLFERPALGTARLVSTLGRIIHIESYFSFRAIKRNPDGRAPLRDDLQLLDVLPHAVYVPLAFLALAGTGDTRLVAREIGPNGTVHALLRRGEVSAALLATLEARPVEDYLRIVGTNGTIHADFVRGTVQRLVGPGVSGIDKLLQPYRLSYQLVEGTTHAMARRFLRRGQGYAGLKEIFEAFYTSIMADRPSPVSPTSIVETVRICEEIHRALRGAFPESKPGISSVAHPPVVVTGGTGFLGGEVVRALANRGISTRVLARREPPGWDRVAGVTYSTTDLSQPLAPDLLRGAGTVIHCAAETAGGWEQHQDNSVGATAQVFRAAATAGIRQIVHVSSLSVLAPPRGRRPISEASPVEPDSRGSGPYAWGKIESELEALRLGKELGIEVKVVRPGALVDYQRFDPPGLLGKRLGNIFVAVGAPSWQLGVADVRATAKTLVWITEHFADAPAVLHALDPELPTKAQLLRRLRQENPDLTVVWLPMPFLLPLSWLAILLQKAVRPGRPAINVARVFARQRYDTSLIRSLQPKIGAISDGSSPVQSAAQVVAAIS